MRIYTSAPIERAFTRDKSWQTPGRREHVHGRVRPMNDNHPDPTGRWFVLLGLVVLLIFWAQVIRWLWRVVV